MALYLVPVFVLFIAKIFDFIEISKNFYYKVTLNVLLILYLFLILGITIPFVNMPENDLVYYNQASHGRNKSLDDRIAVKEYCIKVLDEIPETDKILASEEFLFSIEYYKNYYNYNKNIDILSYKPTGVKPINIDQNTENFINENLKNNTPIWLFCRNNEYYFQCSNSDFIENLLQLKKVKHEKFEYNDIYLIHIFK